ncbi:MAG: chitobiase/beta-hexosaminidase C-terminal domain-containing protein [Prevotella sp.]|nr:chitobiase/beta-hexosaminidase C-terminal domain-containing protein [Prevotella sp.]
MNRFLRLSVFLAIILMGGNRVFAEDFTFNAEDIQNAGIADAGNTATNGTFTFTAVKNNGSTAPAYNANGKDLRMYAKNTFTITNSAGNMTKIVFTISTQGKKRLAEISASTGTIATQAIGDVTVTWTGSASEVSFTVGDKAVYGSDGETKAGQFDFSSIVITADAGEGGSGDTPGPDPDPDLQTMDNIAAFKALANGTEAILKLNNAQVLYAGTSDIYVRDNTGAIDFYNTGLSLTTGQVLNGSVIGKYTLYNNTPELAKTDNTKADKITATAGTVTPKTLTIAEAKNESYVCDFVKITGVTIVSRQEDGKTNIYATVGDEEVQVYDRFKVVKGTPEENTTYDVEGIMVLYKDVYEIYPTKDYTNGEGEEPPVDPDLPSVDNIAAFKALDNGTEAILKLNNAQVLYAGTNDVYVRDNSGAIDFFKTGLTFTTGQVLNGSVIGKYTLFNNTPELAKTDNTNAEKITATAGTVTPKTLTIAEAKNDAYVCDFVKIMGVTIVSRQEGNNTNIYATVGGDEVQIFDKFKVVKGTPEENTTYDVEGIMVLYKDVYEIYPTKDYTDGQGGEPPVIDPTEVAVPYSIDFTKGQGAFTINDVVLPEGLDFVWSNSSSYGMKASAYVDNVRYVTESWLVSPVFDMTSVTAPVLTFSHTGKFFANMEMEATIWVKVEGGDWEQLTIPTWFTGNDWKYVDAQIDLSKYAGKKVTLGFRYTSSETSAATWEIKTLSINEVKEAELVIQGEQEFETSTTVTIIPSNPDNEVYYTIDGTDPVDSKTAIQYTAPFTLTETTTVRAFEEGAELYAEMTFTKKEVQLEEKTIADLNEMTKNLKNVKLTLNNAQVTYIDETANGKNVYLREGDKCLMLFNTALTFNVGDMLNGFVIMDYNNYYGIHEMKDNADTNADGIQVTAGTEVVPTEATIPEIIALNHKCDLVVLHNVKVVADGSNYFAEDADGQRVQLYKGIDVSALAGDGFLYDIEGLFNNIYRNAPEVQPVKATQTVAEGIAHVVTRINDNSNIYNLSGQRVDANYRGVVIVNGKKIVN